MRFSKLYTLDYFLNVLVVSREGNIYGNIYGIDSLTPY